MFERKEEGREGGRKEDGGREEGKEEGVLSLKARKKTVLNSGNHLGNVCEEQMHHILLDETFRNKGGFFFLFLPSFILSSVSCP